MKKMPKGRTLAEFLPLTSGEMVLLKACADGEVAKVSDNRPTEKSAENMVRASFIRFMALGGDDDAPVHEQGVQLQGAWIEGKFNLTGAVTSSTLALRNCHFESALVLEDTEIGGMLSLNGSLVPGINADRLQCKGSVFLQKGFTATSEVRLLGAQIDGNLNCSGAKLHGEEINALSADRAVIKGSVFLREGFTATGTVRLLGAQIGGNLGCKKATLDGQGGAALSADQATIGGSVFLSEGFSATGTVRLLGVQIGGNLTCKKATLDVKGSNALSMDGMIVNGSFFFCGLVAPVTGISLSSAKVSRLIDDAESWGERLILDGFVYQHLAGSAPTDAGARLVWLNKQHANFTTAEDFRPQPWKQLQTVLRNMGHVEDARQIAIAFEDNLRLKGLIGQTPPSWPKWQRVGYRYVAQTMHALFKILIGYGYRPLRLGAWMIIVWLFCAGVYWSAALQGAMSPSNPLVFQNLPKYDSCTKNWYLCAELPEEYTGFSPLAYSLDLLLPLVNLQQEQDWAALIPTPKETWYQELFSHWTFKHVVRMTVWFEILFGWVASLLLVAVVSGLTKRSEE